MRSVRSYFLATSAAVVAALSWSDASATNGAAPHCVGVSKCGMGGAGMAIAHDAVSTASNPALGVRVGNSVSLNAGMFHANIEGITQGNPNALGAGVPVANQSGWQRSDFENFPNGSVAVNYRIANDWAINLAFFPGGGGASNWTDPRVATGANTNPNWNDSKIWTAYYILQPSVSYSPRADTSIGFGVLLTRQDMLTNSLDAGFAAPRPGPQLKKDTVYGAGFQFGLVHDFNQWVTGAANYRSPVWLERFDVYRNTFRGPMNLPQIISAGLAFHANPDLDLAVDVKQLAWSDVNAIGKEPSTGGFGWQDQPVIALGAQYRAMTDLTLRIGYNYGKSPIDQDHIFANFLFPAIVEHHFTAGAAYQLTDSIELGFSGYYSPETELKDSGAGDTFSQFGANTTLTHTQYGGQVMLNYNF